MKIEDKKGRTMKHILWTAIIFAAMGFSGCGDSDGDDNGTDSDHSDGDVDGDTDTDTDSDTDGDSDGDTGNLESCAALKFTMMSPTAPKVLADVASASQAAIDNGDLIYLWLSGETNEDTMEVQLGLGEEADGDNTFSLSSDVDPINVTLEMSGNDFTSNEEFDFTLIVPLPATNTTIAIPMQEVTMTGSFASDDHCDIGTKADGDDGPTAGGEMSGLVTVTDADDVELSVSVGDSERTFTLCAYLAYGLVGIMTKPDCSGGDFTNPPDDTTKDGADAWRVTSDIAATAVNFQE